MAAHTSIQDSWQWFPEYKGALANGDEFIVMKGGKAYRASREQVRQGMGLGWVWYTDSVHTSDSRQTITADTRTLITIDQLGAGSEIRFKDGIPAETYSNNTLYPQAVGETYELRLQFKLSPTASSGGEYIVVDLDIGSGAPDLIYEEARALVKGQSVTDPIMLTIPIFCLEKFFFNGGKFYITPSIGIELWDKAIFIQRVSQP
jgi:hypothetical protein